MYGQEKTAEGTIREHPHIFSTLARLPRVPFMCQLHETLEQFFVLIRKWKYGNLISVTQVLQ